jgi:hypothetical protein
MKKRQQQPLVIQEILSDDGREKDQSGRERDNLQM